MCMYILNICTADVRMLLPGLKCGIDSFIFQFVQTLWPKEDSSSKMASTTAPVTTKSSSAQSVRSAVSTWRGRWSVHSVTPTTRSASPALGAGQLMFLRHSFGRDKSLNSRLTN